MQRLPTGVPIVCVHAPGDDEVRFAQSEAYVAAATAAGDDARLVPASGDHYTLIDTATSDWRLCADAVDELLDQPGEPSGPTPMTGAPGATS
jgi:hypothetical protein